MNNLISIKKISKSFCNNKNVTVLKKIDYSFTKGKIYSLMGPSGSGKSTLLNILSMIDKPTTGSLSIINEPVVGLSIIDKIFSSVDFPDPDGPIRE